VWQESAENLIANTTPFLPGSMVNVTEKAQTWSAGYHIGAKAVFPP
jgi:hypothetical protein